MAIGLAKAVAIAGEPAIGWIAQHPGHDAQQGERFPGPAEARIDGKHRVAVPQHLLAVHDDQTIRIGGIDAAQPIEPGSRLVLHGGEAKAADAVVAQHELGVGRAKDTHGIEDDDGALMFDGIALAHACIGVFQSLL